MIAEYLRLYDKQYFYGGREAGISGYADYAFCRELLFDWSRILDERFGPGSVLDVGAAYGFVPEYFARFGMRAVGIEPSEYARSQSVVPLVAGALPVLPIDERFDLVTCTEVMEHIPEELIDASIVELARVTGGTLVLLIRLDGPEAHEDAGHICLHDREWWEARLAGMVTDVEGERRLNTDPLAARAGWSGRIFVRRK